MTQTPPPLTRSDLLRVCYLDTADVGYQLITGQVGHIIDIAALAAIDARLPRVMEVLTNFYPREPFDAANALTATLRYWEMPTPINMDTFYPTHEQGRHHVLDYITSVVNLDDDGARFELRYARSSVNNHCTMVVEWIATHGVDVDYTWCEQHFPGSVDRINAALALDLSQEEVAQFGFYADTPAATASVHMPASLAELLP